MKKFLSAALAVLFTLGFATFTVTAQQVVGPEQFGFAFASDYGKWIAVSAGDNATTGTNIITTRVAAMGQAVTPDGRTFQVFSTTSPVLIDGGGANPETLTPSAVSCVPGGQTCSITVSTSYAHYGNYTIQSGTYGLAEAYNACLNSPSGKGTVLIGNGWAGSTTTITTTFPGGSANVNILDVRNGSFQFYTSSGSTYSASLSPFNSTVAEAATAVTATGAPFFYTGAFSQATNHGIADVANAANTSGATIDFLKTRATGTSAAATTTIVSGDNLATFNAFGADGTQYTGGAFLKVNSVGTIASTSVASQIVFSTSSSATPSTMTTALTLDQNDSAIFGQSSSLDASLTSVASLPRIVSAGAPGSNAELVLAATGASATGNQLVAAKTRTSSQAAPATTVVVTGDDELNIRAFGADGTNYIESAQIEFQSTGTVAATRVPGKIVFKTGTDAAPTVLTAAVTIDKDQTTLFNGGIKQSAAGTPTFFADTGKPLLATPGSNTTGIAHQLWYTQMYIPTNFTITNIAFLCGQTCTTDKQAMGVWNAAGTLLAWTATTDAGGTTLSGAGTWQKVALATPLAVIGPQRLIVGVVTSGTTAGDLETSQLPGEVCAVATGQGTLATFSPATTTTNSSCPFMYVD